MDKEARFKFIPKGELVEEGTPFDTPDAEFRRYQNLSCFESILKKHEQQDPAVLKIGEIIHDIEINYWGRKKHEISQKVNVEVRELIKDTTDWAAGLKKSDAYFDKLYQSLKK